MTKKQMRTVLDVQLSDELVCGSAKGYLTLLRFAFFSDLISGSEFKRLHRVLLCLGGVNYVVSL